ncbi:MAG: response regulator [Alphaproteobacteria bacterium]|jgi:DNA-binding NtrC family response regulator|nr:response regulator [Alphaproteobacteria bacterium]
MSVAHENMAESTSEHPSILVVDDEKLQRDQLVDSLSDLDVEVFQAGNGEEALEVIEAQIPSLVIMDIRMPVLDGVETVDKLAEIGSDIKVILMTGDPTSLRAAYKRRPDVFTIIEKPIPLRVLRRFVIEALGLGS